MQTFVCKAKVLYGIQWKVIAADKHIDLHKHILFLLEKLGNQLEELIDIHMCGLICSL